MNHTVALGFHILFVLLWVIALLDVFNKANLPKIDIFIKYDNCYSCQIINANIWITKTWLTCYLMTWWSTLHFCIDAFENNMFM